MPVYIVEVPAATFAPVKYAVWPVVPWIDVPEIAPQTMVPLEPVVSALEPEQVPKLLIVVDPTVETVKRVFAEELSDAVEEAVANKMLLVFR